MMSSLGRKVLVGTGWLAAWRMVSRLLGFISLLFLTRMLVPADFGLVALASSVSASIDAFSQLGVRDALVRLRDKSEDYYNTAFTFQAARGLLTSAAIAVFSIWAGDIMGDERLQPILLVLAALAAISGFENIGTVWLDRNLDFRTQVLLLAVPRLLGFVLTVVVTIIFRSYWALIIGMASNKLLSVAVTYLICPHMPRPSLRGWRYLTQFSLWSWGGSIALVVWSRCDSFIIGPALGTTLLGLALISGEIAILPVTELIAPVMGAMFPAFALAHRTDTMPHDMVLRIAGVLAFGAMPFTVGISACSGYLAAGLLGSNWNAAQPLIAVLASMCIFAPFSYVCGSALSAQGHVKQVFFCNSVAATARVVAIYVAVLVTHDLVRISMAGAGVVAIEAALFIWQIVSAGNTGLCQLAGTMARGAAASAISCFAMTLLPGTWQVVTLGRAEAVLAGGLVGFLAFAVFFAADACIWVACGRPDGAEQIIFSLFRQAYARRHVR